MNTFTYSYPVKICFGEGAAKQNRFYTSETLPGHLGTGSIHQRNRPANILCGNEYF